MNYLKQVNKFYELLLINPLNANSQCLYFALLNINNKCNWIKNFTVANTTLMTFTGLNISALQRARNNLIQKGYVKYQKGKSNNAGIYEIIEFEQQNEQQNEQQSEQHDEQQTNSTTNNTTNTLNKLNKTKQNQTKHIKKKETKKETDFDKLINENFSDAELKNTIYEFIKMRKTIKKPLTTRGLELMIKKLYELSTNVNEQIEILNNSIMKNWLGIFPLKKDYKTGNKGSFDDFKEIWEEARIEDEQTGNSTSNNSFSW